MKVQELAIIFIIIILPFSIVLSAYTQQQMEIINLQTQYDAKLTSSTYDAIKAFKLNTTNNTESDLANSKIRDIEASIKAFRQSMATNFGIAGYDDTALNSYIPALVYTMYDGYYIYSPYTNENYLISSEGNPIDKNGETIYGLKPYIYYSCRYKRGADDFTITYALDNYITIQGMINGKYVSDSGYLIDNITFKEDGTLEYNGITIEKEEALQEYVGNRQFKYIKLNGTKYYWDETNKTIFYLLNGTITYQVKYKVPAAGQEDAKVNAEYYEYVNLIENNQSAVKYYMDAYAFTKRVRGNDTTKGEYDLEGLTFDNAYDVDGTTKLWEGDTRKIFAKSSQYSIEYSTSNFAKHRLEVIRKSIETNLSTAIANYNKYSQVKNEFQMPILKEDEWDLILNNVSLISFVQGLNAGGKNYNGYSIVINSETQEVVQESSIYFKGRDGYYHRVGDKELYSTYNGNDTLIGNEFVNTTYSAGRFKLDFSLKTIEQTDDSGIIKQTKYYPLREKACYTSIINQTNVETYDSVYEYLAQLEDTSAVTVLKKAFYTALGRERWGMYKTATTELITNIDENTMPPINPDPPREIIRNDDEETEIKYGEKDNTITIIARPGMDFWTNQNVEIEIKYGDGIYLNTVQIGISNLEEGLSLAKERIEIDEANGKTGNYIKNIEPNTNIQEVYTFKDANNGTFTKSGHIVVKGYDITGNEVIASMTIDKIERTEPVITADITCDHVTTKSFDLHVKVKDPSIENDNERTSGIDRVEWIYRLKGTTQWQTQITTTGINTGNSEVTLEKTIDNLTYGIYEAYGVIYDRAENFIQTSIIETTLKEMPIPTVDYEPKYYTNGNVIFTGSTTDYENIKAQYQVNQTTGQWKDYTEPVTITENQTIYYRYFDGVNQSKIVSVTIPNIDKINPVIENQIVISNITTLSFKATVKIKDEQTGIAKVDWYYREQNTQDFTQVSVPYQQIQGYSKGQTTSKNESRDFGGLRTGRYYVYAIVYDVAGNQITTNTAEVQLIQIGVASGATISPTTWTNGNVRVTLPSRSGLTAQYKIGNGGWQNYTGVFEVAQNCTIYYRYTDSVNIGQYATINITNIDKVKPTVNSVTAQIGGASFTASDNASGIIGYAATTSNSAPTNFTWCSATTSLNTTISNLAEGTTYYIWVKDQAGNVSNSQSVTTRRTEYTVSYNANGGSGAPGNQIKYKNVNLQLSTATPSRDGYDFTGWKSGDTIYQPGAWYTGNSNITLYAQWKQRKVYRESNVWLQVDSGNGDKGGTSGWIVTDRGNVSIWGWHRSFSYGYVWGELAVQGSNDGNYWTNVFYDGLGSGNEGARRDVSATFSGYTYYRLWGKAPASGGDRYSNTQASITFGYYTYY